MLLGHICIFWVSSGSWTMLKVRKHIIHLAVVFGGVVCCNAGSHWSTIPPGNSFSVSLEPPGLTHDALMVYSGALKSWLGGYMCWLRVFGFSGPEEPGQHKLLKRFQRYPRAFLLVPYNKPNRPFQASFDTVIWSPSPTFPTCSLITHDYERVDPTESHCVTAQDKYLVNFMRFSLYTCRAWFYPMTVCRKLLLGWLVLAVHLASFAKPMC